jgi:mRNA-degrading endonuclease YafQ of YafQ-DinJ toxin-antitoxin module
VPISDRRGDHERHFVVKRLLIRSSVFVRTAKHLVKKQPHIAEDLRATLELLSEDAFHPKLKTHKLKGALQGSLACSAGYDLRIIFEFVQHEGSDAILLQTVGTHDEVY